MRSKTSFTAILGLLAGIALGASLPSARAALSVAFNGTSINSDSSLTLGTNGNTTAVTLTTGQLVQLAHALQEVYGGTNQTTYTTGDGLYASATNTLSKLAIGTQGQHLTVSGGIPAWTAAPISTNDFRLSLTTGNAVDTDQSAKTTVYMTPYKGNRIALYSSSGWTTYSTAEISIALGTLTSGKNYDVFCYSNSGTPTLELSSAWTNDTTRATAIVQTQDGVWTKTGDATRRYVGTFRTTSTTTTADTHTQRFLFSASNRTLHTMYVTESEATWGYSGATIRQANANAANQLDYVVGLDEDLVFANVFILADQNLSPWCYVGIGVNATNANNALTGGFSSNNTSMAVHANYVGRPGAGRNFLAWVEKSDGATAINFRTSNYNAAITAAIWGSVLQ